MDQWYLAEEGGLLFNDVGPFRNFGDIGTTNARKAKGSQTEGRYGPTEMVRRRSRESARFLRWKEDGGLGLGPGRALIAVRPALLVLIAWEDTVRGWFG